MVCHRTLWLEGIAGQARNGQYLPALPGPAPWRHRDGREPAKSRYHIHPGRRTRRSRPRHRQSPPRVSDLPRSSAAPPSSVPHDVICMLVACIIKVSRDGDIHLVRLYVLRVHRRFIRGRGHNRATVRLEIEGLVGIHHPGPFTDVHTIGGRKADDGALLGDDIDFAGTRFSGQFRRPRRRRHYR